MRLLNEHWTTGTLIRRYKRFLADVTLADQQVVTAHCPNTGAMTNCWDPGDEVFVSRATDPRRKTKFTLELIRHQRNLIGINSLKANDLIFDALQRGKLPTFDGFERIERECTFDNSRFDFKLYYPAGPSRLIEVKSVTYQAQPGLGLFPDAPSVRARKHLETLIKAQGKGFNATLIFCAQHSGIRKIAPATMVDPEYAALLTMAHQAGVMICGFGTAFRPPFAWISGSLPVDLKPQGLG